MTSPIAAPSRPGRAPVASAAAGLINSHLDRARGWPYTGPLRRLADAEA